MLLVTTVMWSVILAATFEFARMFRAFDYRTFFQRLLGPFWVAFEIIYFILLFIVLAVIGSAAGILLEANFGIPYIFGVLAMLVAVGFLTFKGSGLIESFLSIWSILLYAMYITLLVVALVKFGPLIRESLASGVIAKGWALGGFKYALYNLGIIAAVLFCLNHIESRKEAVIAGLLGGPIAIIPGLMFYIAVVGFYPEVLPVEIPAVFVLERSGVPLLLIVFQVVLFGTLIETGTGFIHSVNERLRSGPPAPAAVVRRERDKRVVARGHEDVALIDGQVGGDRTGGACSPIEHLVFGDAGVHGAVVAGEVEVFSKQHRPRDDLPSGPGLPVLEFLIEVEGVDLLIDPADVEPDPVADCR